MIEADKLMEIMEKERETKEDGRYIIFYTFENEGEEDKGEDPSEGSTS